jgi:FixJ family two-component response regulator
MMLSSAEKTRAVVVVIDDDLGLRESLETLFQSVGLDCELFATVDEFLGSGREDRPGCLLLDVRLPGKSGLEFQSELLNKSSHLPIIFMTGHGDIPMTVRAMKAGAVEFLTKPFNEQTLLDSINSAIALNRDRRKVEENQKCLLVCYDTLTTRERAVMALVVNGLMNKQIAGELQLAEVTVKKYRGRLMQKMKAGSVADLVKMSEGLQNQNDERAIRS